MEEDEQVVECHTPHGHVDGSHRRQGIPVDTYVEVSVLEMLYPFMAAFMATSLLFLDLLNQVLDVVVDSVFKVVGMLDRLVFF